MTEPTEPTAPVDSSPDSEPHQSETDWKAEARKWEARAKENNSAAARLAELEDAQKTEAQRLTDQLAAAQAEAAQARGEALRLKVATAKGLPAALATRLQGATEDEMAADADSLLAAFPQPPTPTNGRTPVEALRPGALPNPPEPNIDDQIAAAQKAGDYKAVIRLNGQKMAAATQR